MIPIHEMPISYYVNRLKTNDYFSFAGYSDAEWYCILGIREGDKSGLGQIFSKEHGCRLEEVIRRRCNDPRFLFAIPKCLWELPHFCKESIDIFLRRRHIQLEGYERDMVTDRLAENADLFPLINQLRRMSTVIIGNKHLRKLNEITFRYDHFVEIGSPNLHLEPNGIERAVEQAKAYGQPAAYLVSAGVSAAVIIDMLHDAIPNSFFIDCGSIWDAFVGIGEQRTWRKTLYTHPSKYRRWLKKNLEGGK